MSDDENLRRYKYTTRYGRTSVTVLKADRVETERQGRQTDSVETGQSSQNDSLETGRQNANMTAVNLTVDQLANLLENQPTTIIGSDSLPKFRGRKRDRYPNLRRKIHFANTSA